MISAKLFQIFITFTCVNFAKQFSALDSRAKIIQADTQKVTDEDEELFEGDLIGFNEKTVDWIKESKPYFMSASEELERKWPDAIIPYVINGNFPPNFLHNLTTAMRKIESECCIRFVPSEQYNKTDAQPMQIVLPQKEVCGSTVGRNESYSRMKLHPVYCNHVGILMHELIHVIGFVHEQCREDRDRFIEILYENIEGGTKNKNFEKYTYPYKVYTPYDYGSIMHYSENFMNGDVKSIQPKDDYPIGQREKLSRYDIMKINKYYKCGESAKKCKDKLSETECKQNGLGEVEENFLVPKLALCQDRKWAQKYCARTCGECYHLFGIS